MHLFVREIHVQQLSTIAIFCAEKTCGYSFTIAQQYLGMYPLVNVYITMEHHHFLMGKLTISMAIFNSYFDITRGYCFGGSQNWMTGDFPWNSCRNQVQMPTHRFGVGINVRHARWGLGLKTSSVWVGWWLGYVKTSKPWLRVMRPNRLAFLVSVAKDFKILVKKNWDESPQSQFWSTAASAASGWPPHMESELANFKSQNPQIRRCSLSAA